MRILDLFCGAGGAAMGYHRAGFEVVGVDIKPQPNYPFEFVQEDALGVLRGLSLGWHPVGAHSLLEDFDAAHASPPCQAFTKAWKLQRNNHPNLIAPTRELLGKTGLPWVIENVVGAPLIDPVKLEGQMFPELRVVRPRLFEANFSLEVPECPPRPKQVKMGRPVKEGEWIQVVGHFSGADEGRQAMGIPWMTKKELAEAIPPSYTEFIGKQLMSHILQKECVEC